MSGRIEAKRAGLGVFLVGALVLMLVSVFTPPALGTHINVTGPIASNCVEIQQENTDSHSSLDYPGVSITVNDWNLPEKFVADFTVAGLSGGLLMDVAIKTGPTSEEFTGFGNGAGQVASSSVHQINHIRACVVQGATTTTAAPTTTLASTTTTQASTTTTQASTTTTQASTTTTEASTTTSEASTTSTTIGGTTVSSTLPFTGAESGSMAMVALSLMAAGIIAVIFGRSPAAETNS